MQYRVNIWVATGYHPEHIEDLDWLVTGLETDVIPRLGEELYINSHDAKYFPVARFKVYRTLYDGYTGNSFQDIHIEVIPYYLIDRIFMRLAYWKSWVFKPKSRRFNGRSSWKNTLLFLISEDRFFDKIEQLNKRTG